MWLCIISASLLSHLEVEKVQKLELSLAFRAGLIAIVIIVIVGPHFKSIAELVVVDFTYQ